MSGSEVVGEVCPTEGVEEVLIEETVVEDMAQVVTGISFYQSLKLETDHFIQMIFFLLFLINKSV